MASAAQMAEVPQKKLEFFNSSQNRNAVVSLLLLLLTLISYNPVTHNDFVSFDDPGYITANQHVRAGLTWQTVKWAVRSTDQANWHPITWLSHALDYQLFEMRAAGHHYTSVLLDAAITVFLFLFLQAATGCVWRSATVAALFELHPINVESVAWAAERKSVLCMLFFALMLLAYRWYAKQPDWKRYSLVALLFAMGLLSKPMLVTAPFLLLLLDYWPLNRTRSVSIQHLVLEKLPLLAMSVASSIVTLIAQKSGGAIHHLEFPLSNRIVNALVAYARYLGKAVWPSHLAAFYPHPEHPPVWQVLLSVVVISVISIAVLLRRDQRYLTVGWLWFLGSMVPVIGLVQVGEQAMADRYAYLPFIGLFVAVVWAVADWANSKKISAAYLGVAAGTILIAFAAITHHQIGYWQNTKLLWTHTLAVTGPNFVAEDSLGAELIEEDNLPEAIKHFQAAVAINPRDAFSRLDLGVCDKRTGNIAGAVANYEAALQLSSDRNLRATAFGNLGSIYRAQGDYTHARTDFEASLQLLPDYTVALTGMGLVSEKTGDVKQAANYFARAASAVPSDTSYLLLAQALAKAGRQLEAQAALSQAQQLSRNWSTTTGTVNHLLQE